MVEVQVMMYWLLCRLYSIIYKSQDMNQVLKELAGYNDVSSSYKDT